MEQLPTPFATTLRTESRNPLLECHDEETPRVATPRLSTAEVPILEYSWPCNKLDMLIFWAVYWAIGVSVLLVLIAKSIDIHGEIKILFVMYFGVGIFLALCCPCHVRQYYTHCQLRVGLVGREVEESQMEVP